MNKQKFYPWYDPETHTALLPIQNYKGMDFKNRLLWQLEQIGVELLEIIDLPIDVSLELRHGKIPEWLHIINDDEGEDDSYRIWDFADKQERTRLRIISLGIGMASTHVITRYFPHEFFDNDGNFNDENLNDGKFFPAAFDSQNCVIDEESDMPEPIWISDKPGEYYQDFKLAEDWLDENYPRWRDPSLYWG